MTFLTESAPVYLHVHIRVSDTGNGCNRLDHVADHINNGQVNDGPVGSKLLLHAFRYTAVRVMRLCCTI